jgi:HEAT repeat protein
MIVAVLAMTVTLLQPAPARAQLFLEKNAAGWEQALKDGKDGRARRNAVFALGKLGKSAVGAVATLKKYLREDTDATVREAAAFALGEIGRESLRAADDPDVLEQLAKSLKEDKNEMVRRSAACAIGNFGTSAKSVRAQLEAALTDTSKEVKQNVAWALGRLGPETVPALRKALKVDDPLVRRDAAGSLGQLEPAAARPALPELLDCCKIENSELRLAALGVLVKIVGPKNKDAIADILPALKDSDLEVRQNAALALANIGGTEAAPALPILLDALQKGDTDLKNQAAAAIGNLGPAAESAVNPLINLLSAPDPTLRRNVVLALGGIGAKAESAIPALIRLIANRKEEKEVRKQAAVAMNQIGVCDAARKVVPDLLEVMQDPADNGEVRWRITWALRVYNQELRKMDDVLRAFVKVLQEQARPESKMLRYDCAYMLGMIKEDESPKEVLEVLLEFLKDKDVTLYKETSVQTTGSSAETKAGTANVKEIGYEDGRAMAIQALEAIGPEVVRRRPDVVRQLRAIVDNPDTLPDLKKQTKALLAKVTK